LSSGNLVRFSNGLEIPLERVDRYALQIWAQNPGKDWVEEIIPLAVQKLHQMTKFLAEVSTEELNFMTTHGRRWRAGEGIDFSIFPQGPEVVFVRDDLEASCQALRGQFEKIIRLPARNNTLIRYVEEAYKAIICERRRRRHALRAQGGLIKQSQLYGQRYGTPARRAFIFIGREVEFLKHYIDLRAKKQIAKKAERLALAKIF
jgi:hypothetical protein